MICVCDAWSLIVCLLLGELVLDVLSNASSSKLIDHKLVRDVGILGKRYTLTEATAAGIFDTSVPLASLVDRAISTAQLVAVKAKKRSAMSSIKSELHRDLIAALVAPINPSLLPKAKL